MALSIALPLLRWPLERSVFVGPDLSARVVECSSDDPDDAVEVWIVNRASPT